MGVIARSEEVSARETDFSKPKQKQARVFVPREKTKTRGRGVSSPFQLLAGSLVGIFSSQGSHDCGGAEETTLLIARPGPDFLVTFRP